jgi:hypothetical protein
MFENFTYRQKLIGLSALFVLLFFAANKRSFKVTKNAYSQMKEVKSRLEFMRASNYDSKELQSQITFYNNLIGKQGIEPEAAQQSILDFATQYEKVKIDKLSETHFSNVNGFEVVTNQIVLEGNFAELTEAVYGFEKRFKTSSLVSISYIKEKSYNRRRDKLKVHLIFQNYEKSI